MKRFLSILLVAMLIVTSLATAAFAAGSANVSVSSIDNAVPGNEYTVTFTVSGEFANYELFVKADSGLKLTKISGIVSNVNTGKVAYATDENIASHSFKATFKLDENAKCGSYNVWAEVLFVADRNLVKQTVSTSAGKITVAHNWDAGKVTTEPTCEAAGVKTITCTICGETKTETIPAKGHTAGAWEVTKEATCTAAGEKQQKCTVCGKVIATEVIPAKGHTEGTWTVTKEATCTEAGEKKLTCSVCGEVIKTETIPAKGHTEGTWTVTKEATCTEAGEKELKCSVCGVVIKTEAIAALGHDYVKTAGTATCTEAGWVTYTCSRCGDSYTEQDSPALGHDHKLVETKAATCTEAGYEKYECSRCGDAYTVELKALGHQWCENFECEHEHEHYDEEYHWFLCMICGEKKDVERHDHCIEKGGYLFCECGHWIEVDEPGIDPQPKPGDYSFVMYAGIAALIAMMAAAAYVYKRKMAN